jgi:threonyl-tRNA synthetase
MLIIGGKEEEAKTVAIRKRSGDDLGVKSVEEFTQLIKKDITDKVVS